MIRAIASALLLAACLLPAEPVRADFELSHLTGDADCGVSADKLYTHAYNACASATVTVNGVPFLPTGTGGQPSGTNFSTAGFPNPYPSFTSPVNQVSGNIGAVIGSFLYGTLAGSNPPTSTLTLTGLEVGERYTSNFYNMGWGGPGIRWVRLTTSDGGLFEFDENCYGSGYGNLVTYSYTAQNTSLSFVFDPLTYDTYHLYGFTNEIVDVVFEDSFPMGTNTDKFNLNYDLAARQRGSLSPISYVTAPGANVQIGNKALAIGGNNLMIAFDSAVALDHSFDEYGGYPGLKVHFEMAIDAVGGGDDDMVAGFCLGASAANKLCDFNANVPHFGMSFGSATGAFKAYDGNTLVSPTSTGPLWSDADGALHEFDILLTDTDWSPFNGFGQTNIEVFVDGVSVFTYSKASGGYSDNYLSFRASEVAILDNVRVQLLDDPFDAAAADDVPEPSTLVLILGGLALVGAARWRSRAARLAMLVVAAVVACLPGDDAQAAGTFATRAFTGDADCGIAADDGNVFTINMSATGSLPINGAAFIGTGGNVRNPSGVMFSTSGFGSAYSGVSSNTTDAVKGLVDGAIFGAGAGVPQTISLAGLRVGQDYEFTVYSLGRATTDRWMTVGTSDGVAGYRYNQNWAGLKNANTLTYDFTAQANTLDVTFVPDTTNTMQVFALSLEIDGAKALVSDNFYVPTGTDVHDLGANLTNRQGGTLGTVGYTLGPGGDAQVGYTTLVTEMRGGMLIRSDGAVSPNANFNGASAAGGLSINFDMAPDALGSPGMFAAVNLGMSEANRFSSARSATTHFAIEFEGLQGTFEAFNGGAKVSPAVTPASWVAPADGGPAMHHFELLLSDPTDDNPFDGIGETKIEVFVDGASIYTYTKTGGGYASNYINFEANHLAVIDNLLVSQIQEVFGPGDANGDGEVNDEDASILGAHWLQTAGVEWGDGDFNEDGRVDDKDAAILAAYWGTTSGATGQSVPEPSSAALILAGLVVLSWRRRRVV